MKHRSIKIILICIVIMVGYIGVDIFTHSTIERAIRTDLFFRGYFIKAFRTEICKRPIPDQQYGTLYFCKNPGIGLDSYSVAKKHKYSKKIDYWYIYAGGGG
ncbi:MULTISPECIES: hypothetical protein [Clostridium]|uniref:Uncharacterized protein n=1 Tax=Clostridium ragsdalei P11 TaxID=1353534 RepID=A0A1A6AML4_9CLOT|nr:MULTISPECIES: hypothetical protein [Clostridium]OBR91263.1 hypothetical protein CLRAG_32050 [Clostridium ragsdalei P11]